MGRFLDGVAPGSTVLDGGYGPGQLAALAAEQGLVPVGVDITLEMLRIAAKRMSTPRLACADLCDLPFADASFDAVVCWFSIHNLPRALLPRLLVEARRILTAGGQLLLATHEGTTDEQFTDETGESFSFTYYDSNELASLRTSSRREPHRSALLGRNSLAAARIDQARSLNVTDASADDLAAWDRVAEKYASQPDFDWFDGFLDRHLGDVAGKRVLDLGCGHGWFADRLIGRGAVVDAVDGSAELIEIGRASYPDVPFRQVDLRDGIDGDYDIVIALMLLMDVPDLAVLRPRIRRGGVLLATILHPAFFLQQTVDDELGGYRKVRRYLDEEEWWIESFGGHRHYHRPLSRYVEWIASLGLGVVELFEPPAASYEGWRARIPTRLGLAARPVVD